MVKGSEIVNLGGLWVEGHGLSEGSKTLGPVSRVCGGQPQAFRCRLMSPW